MSEDSLFPCSFAQCIRTFKFTLHLLTGSSVVSALVIIVLVLAALLAGRALRLHDSGYLYKNTR